MNQYTDSASLSQDKWYYAYLVDDIPQQLPADNANGYTGPFDTEREAWLSLYAEMTSAIEAYKLLDAAKGFLLEREYSLPVSGGAA